MWTPGYWNPYFRWTLKYVGMGVACGGCVLLLLLLPHALSGCSDCWKTVAGSWSTVSVPAFVHEDAEKIVFDGGSFSLKNDVYFSSFDGTLVYENRDSLHGKVARRPLVSERRMFDQVRQEVIGYLERSGRRGLSSKDCKDIRYRVVAAAGMELELICNSTSLSGAERVVVQRPFHDSRVVLHTHVEESQTLGIIVPLQGRVEILKKFLDNLLQVTREGGLQVVLTVIYFEDHTTKEVAAVLEAPRQDDNLQTQLILLRGEFSRSRALKIGVEETKGSAEVVFLCDVDLLVTQDFLLRCLASPILGRQVFFPVFFSQYNPDLTNPVWGRKVPSVPDRRPKEHHGYWRLWSYGMVCLYKADFLKIDGFNVQMKGWGGEDIHFASRVLASNYSITRSLDQGLFHLYHSKNCNQAGRGYRSACQRVQALSEASGLTFGLWYFKQKHNTSICGVLRDEEMQTEDIKAAQGEEKGEEEPAEGAEEENEERASVGILEDTFALQTTLLVMIVVNIVLSASIVLTRFRCFSCARRPHPDIG